MDDLSIDDLLARVALRDRKAFSELYDRTSAKLFSVAFRILREQGETEDAVQDAFVKIWRNAGKFEAGRASPMTWLITISRNAAIDRARKRRDIPVDIDETSFEASDDPSPEDFAVMADDHARLRDCLEELEDQQGNVMRAAFFTGHTYAEIADGLETPLGTVKSWIRRSLVKLRDCIDGIAADTPS